MGAGRISAPPIFRSGTKAMKKRLIGVLAFALAVSAGAAFVLYQLIASKMTVGASAKPATTKVLVAARDLELGALIQERDVRPQDYLTPPPGAILKKEDMINRGVTAPIHEDAPFYEASLAPKGAGAGFAATIPEGMRAFAVHVNEVVGVAGFAVAGHARRRAGFGNCRRGVGQAVGSITRTLLQNIEVLSAGQNYQKDAEGKPVLVQVVNLLVTPEQAEILNLATQQTIQLVLRNPADHAIVNTPGASTANLFAGGKFRMPRTRGKKEPRLPVSCCSAGECGAPAPEKPRTVTIEVFQGATKVESTFKRPGRRSRGGSARGGKTVKPQRREGRMSEPLKELVRSAGLKASVVRRDTHMIRLVDILLLAGLIHVCQRPARARSITRQRRILSRMRKNILGSGKTQLLDMPVNIERVSVANPETAEAVPVSARSLMINGKAPGRDQPRDLVERRIEKGIRRRREDQRLPHRGRERADPARVRQRRAVGSRTTDRSTSRAG